MKDLTIEQSIRELVHKVARDEVRQALTEALKPDELITPAQAAKQVNVSAGTVRRWVKQKKLRRHGEGTRIVRVSRNELERLMRTGVAGEMSPEELAAKRFG